MANQTSLARIDAMAENDTTEYGIIESAVMETARGRWFLREYARKNRHADTLLILKAIEKLASQTQNLSQNIDTDHIRRELEDMAQAIAVTRHEIGALHADIEQEIRTTTVSCELDSIVAATEKATSKILEAAEQVQETAWTMREQDIDEESCEKLDALATDIYTACSFQDITGQRTDKVIKVLHYLEERINKMSHIWGTQSWLPDQASPKIEHFRKSGNRFSDKKCDKSKELEPGFDSVKTGNALETGSARTSLETSKIQHQASNTQTDIDTVLEDTEQAQKMLAAEADTPEPVENKPEATASPVTAQPEPALQNEHIEPQDDEDEDDTSASSCSTSPEAINMSALDTDDMHALFCY
jgi:hypothetical protein